ncbi:MAG: rRNA (guanine-N2)-methyltransferase [Treponema sp.]|nr:rRNA (guanine-N2)-methyltransferase [Treponema sp.]
MSTISQPQNEATLERQSIDFANRILKRYKHLKKWAKRTDVHAFRIYDKDIPEIPLAVDIYESEAQETDAESSLFANVALYERPYQKDEAEETIWLNKMAETVQIVLNIPKENIFIKQRKKQRGKTSQYEKLSKAKHCITVREQGLRFIVNLSDYLDTGLFFDHRPLRRIIQNECRNKHVLNLFCYTGAFSVYAAKGGAASVDSVDLSKTYLEWTKRNFLINSINIDETSDRNGKKNSKYRFIQEDAVDFIRKASHADIQKALRCRWDIIVLDPPTFSNSKRLKDIFDINRSWSTLVDNALKALNSGGVLYFSTNSTKLKFDESLVSGKVTDITEKTIPEDFRNKRIHRCWKIEHSERSINKHRLE